MKKFLLFVLLAVSPMLLINSAAAQTENTEKKQEKNLSNEKEEKSFVDSKREGWYVTAVPLANFSSDTGFGGGVRAFLYDNGKKSNPKFATTPYLLQTYLQFFMTTKGWQYHELHADFFQLGNTNLRLKGSFIFDKYPYNNFYGTTAADADRPLTSPIDGKTFTKVGDLSTALSEEKTAYEWYYQYSYLKPTLYGTLLIPITQHFKITTSLEFKYVFINSWEKKEIDDVIQAPTFLDERKDSTPGYDGGWANIAKVGIAYDTRDFEPNPTKGIYADYAISGSYKYLTGSKDNYLRNTVSFMFFHPIYFKSLVFASRLAFTDVTGDAPFYDLGRFDYAMTWQGALGGKRTLRGYSSQRFIGNTLLLGQFEIRWKFLEINPWNQNFGFQLIGFFDCGNVYDNALDIFTNNRIKNTKFDGGAGLFIAWNQATIAHIMASFSKEGHCISIDFEHAF